MFLQYAERWRVWGTPANFHGFRVLAALLHGTLVVGVSGSSGSEQFLNGTSAHYRPFSARNGG